MKFPDDTPLGDKSELQPTLVMSFKAHLPFLNTYLHLCFLKFQWGKKHSLCTSIFSFSGHIKGILWPNHLKNL